MHFPKTLVLAVLALAAGATALTTGTDSLRALQARDAGLDELDSLYPEELYRRDVEDLYKEAAAIFARGVQDRRPNVPKLRLTPNTVGRANAGGIRNEQIPASRNRPASPRQGDTSYLYVRSFSQWPRVNGNQPSFQRSCCLFEINFGPRL